MDSDLRTNLKRAVRISATFVSVTLLIILIFTIEKKTFQALSEIKPIFVFGLFLLWGIFVFIDGIRLMLLTKAGGTPISVRRAVEINLIGYFFAAVTPFQTGGFPFQIVLMRKDKINPGRAMAYLTLRGVSIYGPVYVIAPFLLMMIMRTTKSGIVNLLLNYLVVIVILFIVIAIFSFLKPEHTETFVEKIKPKVPQKIAGLLDIFVAEIKEFRLSILHMRKNRGHGNLYLMIITSSLLALLVYLFIAPAVLYSLGGEGFNPILVMGIQVVLMALLLFVPTPGAGGIAEMGGVALFALVAPKYLLGLFVILWRFFTFYLSAIVGGILTVKEF